jgi:hypothetical protein
VFARWISNCECVIWLVCEVFSGAFVPEKRKIWESCNLSKKDKNIYDREAAMYPTKQTKKL